MLKKKKVKISNAVMISTTSSTTKNVVVITTSPTTKNSLNERIT